MTRKLGQFGLAVLVVLVAGFLGGFGKGRLEAWGRAELAVAVEQVPPAPIAGTADASAVWTGEEFIVFGGGRGGKVDGEVRADGVAYDPDERTWRMLSPAPLGQRERHVAAWTGEEMLVWGGSATHHGIGGLHDGALYDPATDTWRPMALAPAGTDRSHGQAVVLGRTVVIGGGSGPTGAEEHRVLLYDLDEDAWQVVDAGFRVVQLVVRDDARVALLGIDHPTGPGDPQQVVSVGHLAIDAEDGASLTGPPARVELVGSLTRHGGLVVHGDELLLMLGGMQRSDGVTGAIRLHRVGEHGDLEPLGELGRADDSREGPVDWSMMGVANPVLEIDGRHVVVPWHVPELWGVDLDTLEVADPPRGLDACVATTSMAPADDRLFVWSEGSTCTRMDEDGNATPGFSGALLLDIDWPAAG